MSAQTPGIAGPQQGAQATQQGDRYMPVAQSSSKSTSALGTPLPAVDSSIPPQTSPSLQRRSSSQVQRPSSSASPKLARKTSRSSLGSSSPVPNDQSRRPTPKRSISNLITELRGAQATMEAIPEPIILTAPEIANECFQKELARHEDTDAEVIVLFHDACYGHRFSRLKSSKGALSMIVERPERLLASVLGVAAIYVRLGGFHIGARNAPRPKQESPERPPFCVRRSTRSLELTSTYVTNVHGFSWMSELGSMCNLAGQKLAACEKEVARVSSSLGDDKRTLHEGDLYLCEESLNAFQGALGGVADAVDAVFSRSTAANRAFVTVRPPGHHCSADYPSGFCWVNNVHVGIEYAAQTYDLTHVAIIDFDLHHGDGSQSIAWQRNSQNHMKRQYPKSFTKTRMAPDIGYYSLHDINSYPCEMGDDEKVQAASLCIHNAHGQSIWNVHLQTWKTLDQFWSLYETQYSILLQKATEFLQHHTDRILAEGKQKPKAAIFISAGFDASEWEGEGMQRHKVNVPTEFYARFTEDIIKVAQTAGTSCDGRVISVLEGGYSDRALCSSTMSHISGLCSPSSRQPANGLIASSQPRKPLDEQMQKLSLSQHSYDPSWWSPANLQALEHHINPAAPNAGGKKVRAGPHPTYATPTESFAYKVIDPAKFARSVSGTFREGAAPTRPVTPPPPDVDWIVAAHELSKLLVPSNRSTKSHTAEDLLGPKVKKERASSAELATSPEGADKPRQLRTRGKAVAQTPVNTSKRNVSGADRRKTMADLPSVVAESGPINITSRRPSRRSSMASTVSNISTLPVSAAPPVPSLPARASVASVAPNLQVKKTRVTSAVTPAKPKKNLNITTSVTAGAEALSMVSAVTGQGNGAITPDLQSPNDNIDVLASGMKRITLKVGSREESERKAKEKLDADRRARALKAAETRRVNKAAKEAKAAQEKLEADKAPITDGSTAAMSTVLIQQSEQHQMAPMNQQDLYTPTEQLHNDNAYMAPQVAYAQPAYNAQSVPTQHLPVFSSTGYIPFAQQPPVQQGFEHGLHYPHPHPHPNPHPNEHIDAQAPYPAGDPQPMHEYDVWAIPDTPAKQMYDPNL